MWLQHLTNVHAQLSRFLSGPGPQVQSLLYGLPQETQQ